MNEHIHTIPVIDGFKTASGACPFCNILGQLDADGVSYILGSAYMEDDVRMSTDAQGFCREHYAKLFAVRNRLGLGLMLQSHLARLVGDIEKLSPTSAGTLFSTPPSQLETYLNRLDGECYLCNRVNATFTRYVDTFFHLWKTGEIVDYVKSCSGFCMPHFGLLIEQSRKKLSRKSRDNFCDTIMPIQLTRIKQLEADVGWLVKRFDYRFANAPEQEGGKNAASALERCIATLSSDYTKIQEELQ